MHIRKPKNERTNKNRLLIKIKCYSEKSKTS